MFNIIKFELYKILKSKKTYILFGITVFIIIASSVTYFSKDIRDLNNMPLAGALDWQNKLKDVEYNEKDENLYEELTEYLKNDKYDKKFLLKLSNITYKFYGELYKYNIEEIKNEVGNYSICVYYNKFNNKLLENNIEPIFKDEFVGYNFLLFILKKILPLIALVVPVLLCFDIVSKESETGSFKFLLLQPTKRNKVLVSKIIASSIISICIVLIPILLVFGLVSVINGSGDGNYLMLYDNNSYKTITPVFKTPGQMLDASVTQNDYSKDSEYDIGLSEYFYDSKTSKSQMPSDKLEFVSIRKLILTSIPLTMFFIIFVSVLSLLISVITQNNILSIVIGIIISALGYLSINFVITSPILSKICPFYYTQSIRILSGMGVQTALTGLIVLSTYIVVMILAITLIFRKRDVKC